MCNVRGSVWTNTPTPIHECIHTSPRRLYLASSCRLCRKRRRQTSTRTREGPDPHAKTYLKRRRLTHCNPAEANEKRQTQTKLPSHACVHAWWRPHGGSTPAGGELTLPFQLHHRAPPQRHAVSSNRWRFCARCCAGCTALQWQGSGRGHKQRQGLHRRHEQRQTSHRRHEQHPHEAQRRSANAAI